MTIKQQGGVFGRNPTFNNVEAETLDVSGGGSFDSTVRIDASSPRLLLNKTTNTSILEAGIDTTGAFIKGTYVSGGTADVRFIWAASEKMRVTNNGITFNGDTAAANALDDYEEGTWTPVAADASSGGNVAAGGTFTGHYVKIGNSVTAVASLFNVNTTGMTALNDLYITGLPFTSKTSTGAVIYTGSVIMASTTTSGNNVASINAGDAVARIAENVIGGNADYITVGELSSGTADVRITITYLTE